MGTLRMTVDDRPVETLRRFAARRGVKDSTVRATWSRAVPQPRPADHVDERTPVFFLDDLERMYHPRAAKAATPGRKPRKSGSRRAA